jgi:hypothetical protein
MARWGREGKRDNVAREIGRAEIKEPSLSPPLFSGAMEMAAKNKGLFYGVGPLVIENKVVFDRFFLPQKNNFLTVFLPLKIKKVVQSHVVSCRDPPNANVATTWNHHVQN